MALGHRLLRFDALAEVGPDHIAIADGGDLSSFVRVGSMPPTF
jgi:hypothetical protein